MSFSIPPATDQLSEDRPLPMARLFNDASCVWMEANPCIHVGTTQGKLFQKSL